MKHENDSLLQPRSHLSRRCLISSRQGGPARRTTTSIQMRRMHEIQVLVRGSGERRAGAWRWGGNGLVGRSRALGLQTAAGEATLLPVGVRHFHPLARYTQLWLRRRCHQPHGRRFLRHQVAACAFTWRRHPRVDAIDKNERSTCVQVGTPQNLQFAEGNKNWTVALMLIKKNYSDATLPFSRQIKKCSDAEHLQYSTYATMSWTFAPAKTMSLFTIHNTHHLIGKASLGTFALDCLHHRHECLHDEATLQAWISTHKNAGRKIILIHTELVDVLVIPISMFL